MFPLAGLGLKLLGFGGAVKSAAAKIPPKVWYALAVIAAVVAAIIVHQHVAHKHLKAADAAGYARARTEDAKVLAELKKRALTAEANGRQIAQEVRNRNDAENRNIRAAADALSLHGSGAASCRRIDHPAAPAVASGHVAANKPADVAVDPVPDGAGLDIIGVPFNDLVTAGKQCDLDRAEALSWREADQRQRAEWEKLRKAR